MSSTVTAEPDAADLTGSENETEVSEPAILCEVDLYLLGKPIAAALADGWSEDPEESPTGFADRSIRLIHPDGRSIGIRHLWQGRAVQTFAVGGPAPKQSAEPDAAGGESTRLPKGVRYSTGVRFTTASPLEEILTAIRTVLLPAFDGPRPRLRANGTLIPLTVQPSAAQDSGDTPPSPAAKTKARPKSTARRSTSAKRTPKRRTTAAA